MSDVLIWIVLSAFAMSLIAWTGLLVLAVSEEHLKQILLPMVAFSAGSLIGGALLHLIPEALERTGPDFDMFLWVLAGFSVFLLLEQFLNWHHHHAVPSDHRAPFTYLILVADGLHNFLGGLAIASSFLISINVGIVTWIAAAAHELPQELGDFGILLHGGWRKRAALMFNFLSALTIVPGAVLAYLVSGTMDTTFLLPFAAGNFIYIAASDLVPEIKQGKRLGQNIAHFAAFASGIFVILLTRVVFEV